MWTRAAESYGKLMANRPRKEYRHHWYAAIDLYRLIFETYPDSEQADNAMFMVAGLYRSLYRISRLSSDADMAIYYFRRLAKNYPRSRYADDGLFAVGEILHSVKKEPALAYLEFAKVAAEYPKGDQAKAALDKLKILSDYKPPPSAADASVTAPVAAMPQAQLISLRHWSNPTYTRVVLKVDRPVRFNHNLLSRENPVQPRLYIDLFKTSLGAALNKPVDIGDGLLKRARAGQFTDDTVRVVLDMVRINNYRIFPLSDPFRIVVDIQGNGKESEAAPMAPAESKPPVQSSAAAPAAVTLSAGTPNSTAAQSPAPAATVLRHQPLPLARQLGLSIRTIVLDPGHGGDDPGALGVDNLQEKDVTLDVALRLRRILIEKHGLKAVMTRETDTAVPLEERTAIANTSRGDLFLSIHCNASPKKKLRGVETFFLNFASSREAAETAARENMTSLSTISDFEKKVVDLFMSMKVDESSRFARLAHDEIFSSLRRKYKDTVNLGVRQAPFVVLIGASMPSILAEISFINHPIEGKRLAGEDYRQHIAESLAGGIQKYISSVSLASSK